jgi:phosphoserine phosphatase
MTNPPFTHLIFDVDSTLANIEGLDWLADKKGLGDQVKTMTEAAMNGQVKMQDIFEKKVNLIAPSRFDMQLLGNYYTQQLVEDAADVITIFQTLDKQIHLVTGSFQPAIDILAQHLHLPSNHIFANPIIFKPDDSYDHIQPDHPLSNSGGKATIVQQILKKHPGYSVFVGDSVTDKETDQVVDQFIGYGGIIIRHKVKHSAKIFITCHSLSPLLSILLTNQEKASLTDPNHTLLLQKGDQLITQGYVEFN